MRGTDMDRRIRRIISIGALAVLFGRPENGRTALVCVADVTPRSGMAVLDVQCQVTVQGGEVPFSYSWDFDDSDGLQVDKYHTDPSFVYGKPGEYAITVTVTDRHGDTAKDTVHVTVRPRLYQRSAPLEFYDIDHRQKEPYIIEGLDITNANGCGIKLERCHNVVVRNCWFHRVTHPDSLSHVLSDALAILNSTDISVENCLFTANARSILADTWGETRFNERITVKNCVVERTRLSHGIFVLDTDGVSIFNNVLRDNGDPAHFEKHRITGIICWASHHVEIRDNFVAHSSSDGIGVAADNMLNDGIDPGFVSRHFAVYRNTCRANGEQGIWASVAADGDIRDNYIEQGASSGIMLEYKVLNTRVHANTVRTSSVAGIFANQCQDVEIVENLIHEPQAGNGAIWLHQLSMLPIHTNYPVRTVRNTIANNIITNSRHGILITRGDSTVVRNNTLFGCGPYQLEGYGGILVDSLAGYTLIKNNIIAQCQGWGLVCLNRNTLNAYNDLYDSSRGNYLNCSAGTGDIQANPIFAEPMAPGFFLQAQSPCIDAGDPADPFDREPAPNGGRVDMGAHGNTQWATPSLASAVRHRTTGVAAGGLGQNFPNPFNGVTVIPVIISVRPAKLTVYDARGRLVHAMHAGGASGQTALIPIDASTWPSGVYFYELRAGSARFRGKMLLLR